MFSPLSEPTLPATIEVCDLPHGVRFTLPARPLSVSRRFFILLSSAVGGLTLVVLGAYLIKVFFRTGAPWIFQLIIWGNVLLGVTIVAAGFGAIGSAIRFILGRSEVEITSGKIVARERLGPLRWNRFVAWDQVRHLTITIPSKKLRPSRLCPHRATLIAMGDVLKPTELVGSYPVIWLLPLAEELAHRWGVGATDESATLQLPTVQVVQTDGMEDLDLGDAMRQPPRSRVRVAFHADGITLRVPPLGIQHDAGRQLMFAVSLGVFLLVVAAFIFLGFAEIMPWRELLFFFVLLAFIGLGVAVLLTTAYKAVRNRAVLQVSDDRLLVTQESPSGRTEHEWNRDQIALIGVGPTSPIDNSAGEAAKVLWELQVYPKNATYVGLLAGRDVDELRWIATSLRWALQLPREPVQV